MANYDTLFDITGKTALQARKKDVSPNETRRLGYYIGHEFFAVHSFRTDSDK